jgi:thiamine-phosphate pyrophosphorylase
VDDPAAVAGLADAMSGADVAAVLLRLPDADERSLINFVKKVAPAVQDDAMTAGEAGADYVMFGDPDEAGNRVSFDAIIDRVGWWAEVFEVPCVAYAARLEEIDALAAAGADFVAIGAAAFDDPRGLKTALAEAAARLGHRGSAP